MESLIGKVLICTETGKEFIGANEGISVNYATNDKGEIFSNEGVNIAELRELNDLTKPVFAYVSSNSKHITGWKGNILMNITWQTSCKLSRLSYTHSEKSYKSFKAKDANGNYWHGRSSAGICITMRAYKK